LDKGDVKFDFLVIFYYGNVDKWFQLKINKYPMLLEGSINLLKGKAFADLSKLIFNKKS